MEITDIENSKELQETARMMFDTHRAVFETACEALHEAIFLGHAAAQESPIGVRRSDARSVVRAASSVESLCVSVDAIDARHKDCLTLVVREKESSTSFKARLALNPDDYADYEKILDLVWDSARFPDRYFWAETTVIKRQEQIVSAVILSIGLSEEDLPQAEELES